MAKSELSLVAASVVVVPSGLIGDCIVLFKPAKETITAAVAAAREPNIFRLRVVDGPKNDRQSFSRERWTGILHANYDVRCDTLVIHTRNL